MGIMIESEQSPSKKYKETAKHYDNRVNRIIRDLVEKNTKYGEKGTYQKDLAKKLNISFSKVRRCISGYSTLKNYEELKRLADYSGENVDDLINPLDNEEISENIMRKIPDDLIVNGVDLFSKEAYEVLCKHVVSKGTLIPYKDEVLEFLNYLICDEDFITSLSKKNNDIRDIFKIDTENALDEKKISLEEYNELINYSSYQELKEKSGSEGLNNIKIKNRETINDKLRDAGIRDFTIRYIRDSSK